MVADLSFLTSKQRKVYNAIETFIKNRGIPPTVREIGEMVGEKTPGAVQGILNRLAQKGFIRREVGAARSIQLVSDNTSYAGPVYIPEIIKITQRNADDLLSTYNIRKYQPFPAELFSITGVTFIIACPDNSLAESGITYDDLLIIEQNPGLLKDGDIVLVLYENHLILRKYYFNTNNNSIKLKADSDLFKKDTFSKYEVKIIGKLIAKISRYQ